MEGMDIKRKFDTTQEYLNQISRYDRTIDNKLIELSQLKELAYGISAISTTERVQSSNTSDRVADICIKMAEREASIKETVNEYMAIKDYIINQIESLEKEIYYEILFLRHVKKNKVGKQYSFEEIAIEINNSYRNTTRLYKKAIRAFENKYGSEYLDLTT